MEDIRQATKAAVEELIKEAKLQPLQIMVVGCSTSEVGGARIGTQSDLDVAEVIYEAIHEVASAHLIGVAFQCCEHLNRALVLERALFRNEEVVNVVPQKKAGGSLATTAYNRMQDPVVVEFVKADAGLDIGDTFIGMHLKHVAVPVRLEVKQIGNAHVTAARVRPKSIGGIRAIYDERLL